MLAAAGCITRPDANEALDEVVYGDEPAIEPELEVLQETPFCLAMRPVTTELKRSIDKGVECVTTDYDETGYFGQSANAMESSFKNACFHGFERYESEVETHERRLGSIKARITGELEIDAAGRIDLTEYGVVPPVYQFLDVQGALAGRVTIGFRDPVVRSVRDLGYTLAQLTRNRATPDEVRESIRRCTMQLCGEETVYTSNIVSAQPEVSISLARGTAGRLRPISGDANVKIKRTATRSFIIEPARRLNLAALTPHSREMMVGQDACEPDDDGGDDGGGEGEPVEGRCLSISHRGIKAILRGCGRSGGSSGRSVTCELLLISPNYDQDIELYVGDSSRYATSMEDDRGAPHRAAWGELANIKTERLAKATLVADVSTNLTLQYDDVPPLVKGISRLTLRMRSQTYVEIDFRDIDIANHARFPTCGKGR